MLGCGTDFYIPTGKSLTLPEYPGIQLSSDIVYPERASDPTGYGLGYARLSPPAFQMLVPSRGCYLCFWPTWYRSEVPMTPSNNLLQWLTELRETLYLLGHQCVIKESNSEHPDGRDAQGKVSRKGPATSMLSPSRSLFPPKAQVHQPQKLSEPSPFGPLWRLHYSIMIENIIGHWWLSSISNFSFLPGGQVLGLQVLTL